MGISRKDWQITHISNNTETLIGLLPEQLLGQSLNVLLETEQIKAIAACNEHDFEQINPLKLSFSTHNKTKFFNGIIHILDQACLILELEPNEAETKQNPIHFYQTAKKVLDQIKKAEKLSDLCQIMVEQITLLTGFDRVMIYQFDESRAGNIIAEDRLKNLESYLGLHYPDSDISRQAKYLYTLNLLRSIPQMDYEPASILTLENRQDQPLDLSLSILRSVSPLHIEYLQNMAVKATLTISLIKQEKLWGLIACHHQTPFFVPYEMRNICEFLGRIMSLELASKEVNEDLDYKMFLKSEQAQLIHGLGQAININDALIKNPDSLLAFVGATGAVIYTEGNFITIGNTPSQEILPDLINWLNDQFQQDIFVTNALPKVYPPAIAFKEVASGLLALSITKIQKNYILWFRPEVLQKVNWAGNPDKFQQREEDGRLTISPHKSFKLWQETISLQSLPWKLWEIEGAKELRNAIVGIVVHKINELTTINLELERSNSELDAFAYIASHDLKEPLRGIHNYSNFLLEDYVNILDSKGVEKLYTLINLTKRMEDLIDALLHFSRLGRLELNLQTFDLNCSIQSIIKLFLVSQSVNNFDIRIPRPLPLVLGDRVLLEELFTNLISNACKYNNSSEKWAEIGFLDPKIFTPSDLETHQFLTFYVRDNGIGIQKKHLNAIFRIFKRLHGLNKYGEGTGVGLTIVKKILERHYGTIWVESSYGKGTTFYFTLPIEIT